MHLVESLAGDGAPESLGVLDGSDLVCMLDFCLLSLRVVASTYSSARVGARDGPTSLSNPDPLAGRNPVDSVAGVLDGFPEDVCGVFDGAVLEVEVAEKLLVSMFQVSAISRLLTHPCR